MWLFVGAGKKFEPVPDGRQVERVCDRCHQRTVFYERRVTQRVSLYFVDLFAFSPKHVMACGACGAGYAVDDLEDEDARFFDAQKGTALGVLADVTSKARSAIDDANLAREAERAGAAAEKAASAVNNWVKKKLKR